MHAVIIIIIIFSESFIATINTEKIMLQGINNKEIEQILHIHNEYREELATGKIPKQPRARNMKILCWDEKLASEAQRIANTLKYEHAPVHGTRWEQVGQNLAMHSSTNVSKTDWKRTVTNWFNEVEMYKFGDASSSNTNHYTQIAWANTTNIGCGYTSFMDPSVKLGYKQLYVCNYGPAGNIKGVLPYHIGRCGCKTLCKRPCRKTYG